MSVLIAFLVGIFTGMLLSAFSIVANDETDVVYKEAYLEGYSDGKKARAKNDNSGNET